MKNSEIKELTNQELQERLDTAKAQLENLKLNHSISPLDNPLQLRDARKDIARMATELRRRELNM